jgi:prevent-host-death family protein
MKVVNVHEAKTNLSRLLASVARGEEVVIAKAGEPVAKLVSIKKAVRRTPGALPGLKLDPSFWEALPEAELAEWEK